MKLSYGRKTRWSVDMNLGFISLFLCSPTYMFFFLFSFFDFKSNPNFEIIYIFMMVVSRFYWIFGECGESINVVCIANRSIGNRYLLIGEMKVEKNQKWDVRISINIRTQIRMQKAHKCAHKQTYTYIHEHGLANERTVTFIVCREIKINNEDCHVNI